MPFMTTIVFRVNEPGYDGRSGKRRIPDYREIPLGPFNNLDGEEVLHENAFRSKPSARREARKRFHVRACGPAEWCV